MNIDKMTDQEKSVMLARMLKEQMLPGKYLPVMSPEFMPVNLYDPANMALAWRVLDWATDTERRNNEEMCLWWEDARLHNLSPADAQRAWLDKVLALAIEAGLVAEEG